MEQRNVDSDQFKMKTFFLSCFICSPFIFSVNKQEIRWKNRRVRASYLMAIKRIWRGGKKQPRKLNRRLRHVRPRLAYEIIGEELKYLREIINENGGKRKEKKKKYYGVRKNKKNWVYFWLELFKVKDRDSASVAHDSDSSFF